MWRARPIKALLFDIGGVVVHADLNGFFQVGSLLCGCSEEDFTVHAAGLIAQLERGEIDTHGLWEGLKKTLQEKGLGRPRTPENLEELWTLLLTETLEIDRELLALCTRLQGKVAVGALSNTISEHARLLQEMGAYTPFNPCVLSFEVGLRKPEPEIYRLAAELINSPPSHCLFIDDDRENIEAAGAAGMQTHLFTDRGGLEAELRRLGLLEH